MSSRVVSVLETHFPISIKYTHEILVTTYISTSRLPTNLALFPFSIQYQFLLSSFDSPDRHRSTMTRLMIDRSSRTLSTSQGDASPCLSPLIDSRKIGTVHCVNYSFLLFSSIIYDSIFSFIFFISPFILSFFIHDLFRSLQYSLHS